MVLSVLKVLTHCTHIVTLHCGYGHGKGLCYQTAKSTWQRVRTGADMLPLLSASCRMKGLLFLHIKVAFVLYLVAQSCSTLWDPMDCSRPGSSVHGDFPGKNTGVGSHALLQRIFPTQGSNLSTVSTSESSLTFELRLQVFWAAPSQWLSTMKVVWSGCPCP